MYVAIHGNIFHCLWWGKSDALWVSGSKSFQFSVEDIFTLILFAIFNQTDSPPDSKLDCINTTVVRGCTLYTNVSTSILNKACGENGGAP